MSTETKKTAAKKKSPVGNVVWFDIPADDMKRAKKFYSSLFGWKINPIPNMPDYWHVDTGGLDDSADGAIMQRMHSKHTITNYVFVESVARAVAKIKRLGGKITKPKTAVPTMGYFAIFRDTEGNEMAVWEMNPKAK